MHHGSDGVCLEPCRSAGCGRRGAAREAPSVCLAKTEQATRDAGETDSLCRRSPCHWGTNRVAPFSGG